MAYLSNAERREQFIEAAGRVIKEHGITKATTRRIADEANAPLGALHYCFRSKEQIFEELLGQIIASGIKIAGARIERGVGVSTGAVQIMRAFAEWMAETADEQLTETELSIWAIRNRNVELPKVVYKQWLDAVVELLRDTKSAGDGNKDLDAIASLIIACSYGNNLQSQFMQDGSLSATTERAARVLLTAIDHGVFDVRPTKKKR